MIRYFRFLAPVALLAISACATSFKADVSRFQAMPAPQGQTFAVVADNPRLRGGLEFSTYASMISDRLRGFGYVPAADPALANLIVSVDYFVDRGREKLRSTPGTGFGFGGYGPYRWGYGPWAHPYYGFGRRAFAYGWYDPFLFDDGGVESYTVYTSELDMRIARRGTNERLFEGTAKAVSTDDDLTSLVPNLVSAMFTGFPGNSGETVKITIAPPRNDQR